MTFQFKIQLDRLKVPDVWREIAVNDRITFHKFHKIIQVTMGWEDSHMYQFSPKGYGSYPRIELKTPYSDEEFSPIRYLKQGLGFTYDSSKAKLSDYFNTKGDKIRYIYDFGDDWTHTITLKKILPIDVIHPHLLNGAGKCPPEDCGGVWGYSGILEILSDPEHGEYEELRELLMLEEGEQWNPEEFDIQMINNKFINMKL